MDPSQRDTALAAPPHVQLIQLGTAALISRTVYAAAELALADHIGAECRSAEELAGPMGVHATSLYRLMRTLASLGILTEGPDRHFALTPLGAALMRGAPGSAWATLLTFGRPWFHGAFDHIVHAVRTGQTGFEKSQGMPIFDYLARHPEDASLFSETMISFHGEEPAAVAAAYDFSGFGTIVDVGGATGNMLAAILMAHPRPRGVLFDRPYVVTEAPALLKARGVEARVTIEEGDFFESVPAGGDTYVLSHIIHDWSEEQCLVILGNVRRAMKPDARLLLVEMVLTPGDAPHPGKTLDMVMLVVAGGQERTEEEYRSLLARAGFRLARVVPTASAVSVVEAVQN